MRDLSSRRAASSGCARRPSAASRIRTPALLTALAVVLATPVVSTEAAEARRYADRDMAPERMERLRLREPRKLDAARFRSLGSKVHSSLRGARGEQDVIVRLRGDSVGRMADTSPSSRLSRRLQLQVEQDEFIQRSQRRADLKVVARTQMVLNAVFLEVDASRLEALAQDPMVERIAPVNNYEMHLSETVPYIGAAAVQGLGFDGDGVRVAVLDSGIDYTHANLGGEGTPEAYLAAVADPSSPDGLFPTARVVGGYDFVGSAWPPGDLAPDPDPIDDGPGAGHGTHVADIIGGANGVAPAVDLYAVKVCSSVATSCSGVALIMGMEFAVDPNGDGDPEDAVDIINMSLGGDYGQPFDDDLSHAVDGATGLGVLTVASAGNGGNRPYVTGTPAAAPTALSVAQTQVPSASLPLIEVDDVLYEAVFQPWSVAPQSVIEAPVQYGDGAGGNLLGCQPFADGSLAGLVVLVDRGACNFSAKIFHIGQAGGVAGIIGLVTAEEPFAGAFGGESPQTIPGYMISQADSNAIKAAIPAEATIDPANQISLVGTMVSTSSRGPQHESTQLIKPEIGAPGASLSAEVGTGTGETPFGGTSGAAPMVSGSAALLLQAEPKLGPLQVKARLVNAADPDIDTDESGTPAPITRIGGGEVRVDDAVRSKLALWDIESGQPALSFGFTDTAQRFDVMRKILRVRNYSDRWLWLSVDKDFRFANDAENGAVSVHTLPKLLVRPHGDAYLPVWLKIRGDDLRPNGMNSGTQGANPAPLTLNEYDGYLTLTGSGRSVQVPWHVLPRKAAHVVTRKVLSFDEAGVDQVPLINKGVGTAQNDAYTLLAVSGDLPEGDAGEGMPTPDLKAVGVNTLLAPPGFCGPEQSFIWSFAINSWERQQHLLPVGYSVYLDLDRDGNDDFEIVNLDLGFVQTGTLSGQEVTWTFDLATGAGGAFFYTEHATNTANTVLTVCAPEQLGLTLDDLFTTAVDVRVEAFDFYYGGPGDVIDGLTVTPGGERFFVDVEDLPGRTVGSMTVTEFEPLPANSPELGVMLLTNGSRPDNNGGATRFSETRLLYTKEALHDLVGRKDSNEGKGKND